MVVRRLANEIPKALAPREASATSSASPTTRAGHHAVQLIFSKILGTTELPIEQKILMLFIRRHSIFFLQCPSGRWIGVKVSTDTSWPMYYSSAQIPELCNEPGNDNSNKPEKQRHNFSVKKIWESKSRSKNLFSRFKGFPRWLVSAKPTNNKSNVHVAK